MPKGRNFVPPTETDGVWFHHRGLPNPGPLQRNLSTNTGQMLSDPYREDTNIYPPRPPRPYTDKNARNFKTTNRFSEHDNRHSFQDHGVYFEDGRENRYLGKRILEPVKRQHHSNKEYLKHNGRLIVNYDYKTIHGKDFTGRPTSEPPKHRRFMRNHPEGSADPKPLDTSTTAWFRHPEVPYNTPLQVLATSQEPFLPVNHWKYSYHGLPKCYPPYDKSNAKEPLWTMRRAATDIAT